MLARFTSRHEAKKVSEKPDKLIGNMLIGEEGAWNVIKIWKIVWEKVPSTVRDLKTR